MQPVSKYQPLSHYKWGKGCDGWVLVDTDELSVKEERMPPQSAEVFHYHKKAQQFFYILEGTATFEVNNEIFTVLPGNGFHILPESVHRIANYSVEPLCFIVTSQPSTYEDRFNIV